MWSRPDSFPETPKFSGSNNKIIVMPNKAATDGGGAFCIHVGLAAETDGLCGCRIKQKRKTWLSKLWNQRFGLWIVYI